jgi:lipoprotein-releasing system permease protein
MGTANGRFEGVIVRGMRVEDLRANRTLNEHIVAGDIRTVTPASGKVAVGSRLAEQLGLYPGGQITLWNPEGRSTVSFS